MSEPCKARLEAMCACLTGDLPDEKKRELKAHLARCAPCASYFEKLQNDHHLLTVMSEAGEKSIKRIEKNVMRTLGATQPGTYWRKVMKNKWT
jgi:hypothetical protein